MDKLEQTVEAVIEKMTHKENCVMITIGGNGAGWTSKEGRAFRFTFFDEGVVEGSGSWANVLGDEMGDYGITARKGAGAVLGSLQKKGLLVTNGAPDETEGNWWSLTALGAEVAVALNKKWTKTPEAPKEAKAPKAPKVRRASQSERHNRAVAALAVAQEKLHSR